MGSFIKDAELSPLRKRKTQLANGYTGRRPNKSTKDFAPPTVAENTPAQKAKRAEVL